MIVVDCVFFRILWTTSTTGHATLLSAAKEEELFALPEVFDAVLGVFGLFQCLDSGHDPFPIADCVNATLRM
jgi:hypothetical protein